MNIVFYHHDLHGIACALSVAELAGGSTVQYGTQFSNINLSKVREGAVVYLCGLFVNIATITKIHEKTGLPVKVYTNDKNQIMQLENCGYDYIQGAWTTERAPLMSIWKEMGGDKQIPLVYKALSDYHNWTFRDMDGKIEAQAIFHRLSMENIFIGNLDSIWDAVRDPNVYLKLRDEGKQIVEYLDILYTEWCDDLAYWTQLHWGDDRKINALCINVRGSSDILTADRSSEDAKMFINYTKQPNGFAVTLYSNVEGLDVAHIATSMGGGGKPEVAGIRCDKLPFEQKARGKNTESSGIYGNPYPKAHKLTVENEVVKRYVDHMAKQIQRSSKSKVTICGYDCAVYNTPSYNRHMFANDILDCEIGMSYVFTNAGDYRLVFTKLQDDVDMERIRKQFDGVIVEDSVWVYTKLLPFK